MPVNLLRASRVFTFEPPPGVKANLIRTFSTVPAARMCKVGKKKLAREEEWMSHREEICTQTAVTKLVLR